MDELVEGCPYSRSVNLFGFDQILVPSSSDHNLVNGLEYLIPNLPHQTNLAPSPGKGSDENNVSEAVLNYITEMLMEDDDDDWENRPGLIQDSLALQATEKSLYDVLHNPPSICEDAKSLDDDFTGTRSSLTFDSCVSADKIVDSNSIGDQNKLGFSHVGRDSDYVVQSDTISFGSSSVFHGTVDSLVSSFQVLEPSMVSQASSQFTLIYPEEEHENYILEQNEKALAEVEKNSGEHLMCRLSGTKNHYDEDGDSGEVGRSNKQLASYDRDSDEQSGMYEVLLCPAMNPHLHKEESSASIVYEASHNGLGGKLQKYVQSKGSSGGKARSKKQGNRREVVDLMTLLTRCAQAVARIDSTNANELLKQIRQHSSPNGNGTERMAHYLADALEARLAGTGRALDASHLSNRLTAAESLAAYVAFVKAIPFRKMMDFFANKMIWKLTEKATRLHIIDFGIKHGFQWPGLFQHLSLRPGGPPSVRLTGIDFPLPGFRPAERVEETGRRLAYYCERFNVPFAFNGVAKQWDTIRLGDLKIQRDEVLVVNCVNRLRYVSDETVVGDSPRDAVLKLIKRIYPALFIHGIVNGSYSAPFFVTRFREVLFQSYSGFDMFEAILPRDDQGRMLYERDIMGRNAMSVVSCEGTERIVRPETYRQWSIRNTKAGLKQLPLDHEIVKDVRAKVKLGYHEDFVVDEDINWMLQGWKGRILTAISCWKPAH
ncbi:hypothetical protein RHSIM_Rhsim13G0080000 [Rhododendron simsii]|uniref:Scarecrow-like protein 9 n=1 Tax=Rhododendron simsii TaxID=118357 RepID=A0A834L786_RHOSS|nr:hypothetical protein RHSIM_Rhsim13G0080000 [Rhododendron simsii]